MEEWKDIPNSKYEVSSLGNVRRKETCRGSQGKILKPYKKPNGYHYVTLRYETFGKNKLIHRLIAEAFIPNPENLPYVDHKNCNQNDNTIENLRWCNSIQNAVNKRCMNPLGFKGIQLKRDGKFTTRIKKDGKNIYLGTFATAEEASQVYQAKAIELHGEFARF